MGKKNKKKKGKSKEPFLSKKDRKKLMSQISNVDWYDEDSVWDIGVALNSWSIKIRGEVLRRSELADLN